MDDELIVKIVELIIAICVLVATRYIIPTAKAQLSSGKYDKLVNFVTVAVKSAEQIFALKTKSGTAKKEYAVNLIKKFATEFNLSISDEVIDALIESAVNDLKLAQKEAE